MLRFVTVIFAWTENCKNLKAVILFWRHEFFSVFSLSGFLVCSLLACEFSNTDSLALPKQYKTNSCNCATSSLVLWQKMMKQLFLYFWKPNIPFSGFFPILTVFWCSIPFFAIVFFRLIAMELIKTASRWWPCRCSKCVSGLRRLENIEILELHTNLGSGAWMLFRQKWRKVDTRLFFFNSLVNEDK